jgi:AraC-like DNA-binding protein/ligand-binding sensor protein
MKQSETLVETLAHSEIFEQYGRAFSETTGLPLAFRPVESWQMPHRGKRNENPFCALMAQKSRACAACLQIQQQLSEKATHEACTVTCQHGMCDTAVPVRTGDQVLGYLQTGQVFAKKPTQAQFERSAKLAVEWGVEANRDELKQAYFSTRVVSSRQYASIVQLLSIFAEHLSIVSNQVLVQRHNAEPPVITKAKAFIQQHHAEDLSLGEVAKAMNTSVFYFCKMFKKATGINFTDYLSRVRIEKAKNLLLNPNLRISEIAFEVGFQSLTHFNRVFKKILGQSPTEYREKLPSA